MSQTLPLTATQTPSVIVVTTAAQTSQTVSATHSQVIGESSQVVPSTLALVLPTAPPQIGTGDTLPFSVASSDPQPPPPATLDAPVTVPVTIAATAPVDQLERQSLGLDFDYDQFELTAHLCT